jgi:hypothetical protein
MGIRVKEGCIMSTPDAIHVITLTPRKSDVDWINAQLGYTFKIRAKNLTVALMMTGHILARDNSNVDFGDYEIRADGTVISRI